MFKKTYFTVVCLSSFLAFIIFGTIAIGTILQDQYNIVERKHITFRIDSSFSIDKQEAIKSAFLRWERATNGYVKFSSFVDDISIMEVFSWQEDMIPTIYDASSHISWKRNVSQNITISNNVLGVAMHITGDIFIVDDMPERFEAVVTHEIGHILIDSYHSDDINSIMYPTVGSNFMDLKITQKEVSLVKRLRR